MDPLSISVSIIALIQATNEVVSLCYNFATGKSTARTISELLDQLKSLRNVLESLEHFCKSNDLTDPATSSQSGTIIALCDMENGPIAKELTYLGERLRPPNWASRDGSRRKAFVQSLTWPLKEAESTKTLENIERLKANLQLALTVNQTAMTMAIQETQKKEFKSLNQSLMSLYNDERYWKILGWLSAPDPSTNFNAALKRRHVDTGLWLLGSQQFGDWKAAPGSFLWLHGIPGCGKTVLSSTVLEHILQEEPNNNAVYFYFDFNDSTKQYHDKMLRSLIIQLFSNHQSIPEPLLSLFKSCQSGAKPPQTKDLENLLKALIDVYDKTFIVLDALDECEDRQELLNFIENAIGWKSRKLNVIMTSRKLKEFEEFFDAEIEERARLSIQNEKVDEDIRLYVHGKLQNDRRFKRWRGQLKVREEIETRLTEKSDGMFRWAACQLDVLSGCLSLGKLRQSLDSLPETLDETYDRILCKIDPLFKREVLHVLQWLTCSLRPLSLDEVAEVVAFDVDGDDKFNDENRLAEPEDVLNICSSLVISTETDSDDDEVVNIEPDSDGDQKDNKADDIPATSTSKARATMVRLAHFSVKEYLVSERIRTGLAAFFSIDEEASNATIAATSLSCLQLYDEALFPSSKDFSTEFPLARYSAKFWHDHLSAINGTAYLTPHSLARELFLSEEKMRNWIALYDLDSNVGDTKKLGENSLGSPLYYAVLTGLKILVEALIKFQENKDGQVGVTSDSKLKRQDTDGGSATLQYMSEDAYVNATGGVLHTPLQAASWSGKMDIVELLMNHGADPNIYGGCESGSALSAAAHKGYLDIMKFLLDTGADLYEGILSETSGGSKESRPGSSDVKPFLDEAIGKRTEQDLDVRKIKMEKLAEDEKDYKDVIQPSIDTHDRRALEQSRRTALYGAASCGDAEIARFMLDRDERGTIINLRNNNQGETALSRASWDGHNAVVQTLLQRGALVDKTDTLGRTALMAACIKGHESIARKLLDKGADPICTGQHRGTPMTDAIRNDDEIMVGLLLEKGAPVDVAEKNAGSPLRAAVVRGHEPIVHLLIDHGANVDEYFPLIEAVRRGHRDIAKSLVERGADVNAVQSFDHKDGVPFWLYTLPTTSCLADMKRILYSISNLCLRPNNRHSNRRQGYVWEDSPLWVAAALGDEETVKLLLDNGADTKVRGACAITPLDMAIFEEHEAVVQLLLAAAQNSYSEIEITEENEPGGSAAVEISTPPLHSGLDDISEASQEDFEPPQPSQAPDNSDSENLQPQDTQPFDNSTNMSPTTQQHTQSPPPDSPPSRPRSSHPSLEENVMVIQFTDGSEHRIDLVKMLLGAKKHAKTNGFKRFGQFGEVTCETLMQNPCVQGLKMVDPDNMSRVRPGESSDDDEEEEDDQEKEDDQEEEEEDQEEEEEDDQEEEEEDQEEEDDDQEKEEEDQEEED